MGWLDKSFKRLGRRLRPSKSKKKSGKSKQSTAQQNQKAALETQQEEERQAYKLLLDGVTHCTVKDWEEAIEMFQSAFIAYKKLDDSKSASLVQKVISLILTNIRDPETVRVATSRARRLLSQAGMRDEEVRVILFMANFEATNRDYREAYRQFKSAVSLCRELGDAKLEIEALSRYAAYEVTRGKEAEAKQLREQVRKIVDVTKDPELIALARRDWAAIAAA